MMDTKKCTKCNNIFPATKEYFSSNGRNGLKSVCKSCDNKYHREKYVNVELKINKCIICGKEFKSKLHSNFCSNACRWQYQKLHPTYLIKCKNCHKEIRTNHKTQKYCSIKCEFEYKKKKTDK